MFWEVVLVNVNLVSVDGITIENLYSNIVNDYLPPCGYKFFGALIIQKEKFNSLTREAHYVKCKSPF